MIKNENMSKSKSSKENSQCLNAILRIRGYKKKVI